MQHETITPNKNYPFKLFEFQSDDATRLILPHWHSSIEFLFCIRGNLELRFSHSVHQLPTGGLYLINSNVIHSTKTPIPSDVFVLQIPLEFVKKCTENTYGKKITFNKILTSNKKICASISAIRNMYQIDKLSVHSFVLAKIYEIFGLLLQEETTAISDVKEVETSKNLNKLNEINSYIKSNYKESLTLQTTAAYFNYNPSYFSRFYKHFMGISFIDYLTSVRLDAAYSLLQETDMRVIDISNTCGFGNVKSFYLAFKKQFKFSPQQYRQKLLR